MAADTLFTWGPGNVTTLLTTTMENRRGEIADAVFNEAVIFSWLHDREKVKFFGGTSITVPIMTGNNSTAKSYNAYDILDTTPQEGFTAGQYTWKQYAASISVSGREDRIQNQGKQQIISLVEAKMRQAELTLRDNLNQAMFAASPGTNDANSLVNLIDATSTIAQINSSSNTFWQSIVTTSGSFAAQGLSDMRHTWNTVVQRNPVGGPDLLITDNTNYERYEGILQPQQRFTDQELGKGSFDNLMFKTAPLCFDAAATANVIYFLDSDVLELDVHEDTDFILSEWVKPFNQDAKVSQLLFAGELVTTNRRKLAKMTSLTA